MSKIYVTRMKLGNLESIADCSSQNSKNVAHLWSALW